MIQQDASVTELREGSPWPGCEGKGSLVRLWIRQEPEDDGSPQDGVV